MAVVKKAIPMGMPMRKPASPAPPPFPLKHFAMGTTDAQTNPPVPAAGQTITGGSWSGPAPQTPATPSLGGQNQNLRKALNMGVPRFATGSQDVPPPQPLPQQENLTFGQRRVGWNPPTPRYAGGTPDAGPAMANTNPPDGSWQNQPGVFESLLSGRVGPVAVGAAARQPAPPQLPPPATQGQPGGSVPPGYQLPNSLTGFNAPPPVDPSFQFTPPAGPAFPGAAPGAPAKGSPAAAQGGFNAPPPQGPTGGLMDYLVGGGAPAAGVHPNGQPHGDPDKIAATAAATGADPSHAAAMLEPHQYTHDEFVAATRNMPWGVAEKLWGMQHYLNPVQQLLPQHVQSLQNDITQASKEYEEATVPAVKAEALKQLNGRRDVLNKLIQNLILPQGLPYNQ